MDKITDHRRRYKISRGKTKSKGERKSLEERHNHRKSDTVAAGETNHRIRTGTKKNIDNHKLQNEVEKSPEPGGEIKSQKA
jgi:hypothetical protein